MIECAPSMWPWARCARETSFFRNSASSANNLPARFLKIATSLLLWLFMKLFQTACDFCYNSIRDTAPRPRCLMKLSRLAIYAGVLTINGALKRIEGKLVKGKTKRECSNRTIPLPAVTIAALRRHEARHNQERLWAGPRWRETGYVFTTRIGTPIECRNLLRDWYRLMEGFTLPRIRFHDLRHSAATLLFVQGVHPRTVMEILGHKDLSTTMRIYGHVVDRMKQEAAAKMDELFGVATNSATKADIPRLVN